MIPSHWFRLTIVIVFFIEVAAGILWVSDQLSSNPITSQSIQAITFLIFLFVFYACGPVCARFLAPQPSCDAELQARVEKIAAKVPDSRPYFLYDHKEKQASTVGLWARHSRIYVTSSLAKSLSDEALLGIMAHENTHADERHIMAIYASASLFTVSSHVVDSKLFFFGAFLLFLAVRRYCEFRADAGASVVVGRDVMLKALKELEAIYPSPKWVRWFSFANPYPTLSMRMQALETGRKALV